MFLGSAQTANRASCTPATTLACLLFAEQCLALFSLCVFSPSSSLQVYFHTECQSEFEDAWENYVTHYCSPDCLFFFSLAQRLCYIMHSVSCHSLQHSQQWLIFNKARQLRLLTVCCYSLALADPQIQAFVLKYHRAVHCCCMMQKVFRLLKSLYLYCFNIWITKILETQSLKCCFSGIQQR